MRKTIEDVIKILKEVSCDIAENKINQIQAYTRIANLALALEKGLPLFDSLLEEKVDFLVFMQTKRTVAGGKPVMIAGEVLFEQWKQASKKFKEQSGGIPTETI